MIVKLNNRTGATTHEPEASGGGMTCQIKAAIGCAACRVNQIADVVILAAASFVWREYNSTS